MRRLVETDAHEGPVYVAGEDALYYTTARPRVQIRRLALGTGEVTTLRADTGVANGMTLDRAGRLLVCEQQPAAITRVDRATGAVETVVDSFDGVPLNSPNDVVVTRDGAIWFTDPSYAHLQGFGPEPQLPDAVYRYADGTLTMVADGFEKPNGLAFSPDERVLYVGDSEACVIWAFEAGERRLRRDRAGLSGRDQGRRRRPRLQLGRRRHPDLRSRRPARRLDPHPRGRELRVRRRGAAHHHRRRHLENADGRVLYVTAQLNTRRAGARHRRRRAVSRTDGTGRSYG